MQARNQETPSGYHQTIQTHYEFQREIGEGGQGTVCLYKHKQTGEEVAIKFEFPSSTDQSVLNESLFLKKLKDNTELRIPQYITHNTINGARYLMIQYLHQSISEYLEKIPENQKDQKITEVAIQMVEAVKQLHDLGIVHRDIKPSNFRVHEGKVYIIDFGNTFEYRDVSGKHKQMLTGQQFKGTLHFASYRTHNRYNQSRRDDIESVAYTILYYITNGKNIEWMNVEVKDKLISTAIHNQFALMKKTFLENKINDIRIVAVQNIINYAQALEFEQQPDYQKINDIFKYIAEKTLLDNILDLAEDMMLNELKDNFVESVSKEIVKKEHTKEIYEYHLDKMCRKILKEMSFQMLSDINAEIQYKKRELMFKLKKGFVKFFKQTQQIVKEEQERIKREQEELERKRQEEIKRQKDEEERKKQEELRKKKAEDEKKEREQKEAQDRKSKEQQRQTQNKTQTYKGNIGAYANSSKDGYTGASSANNSYSRDKLENGQKIQTHQYSEYSNNTSQQNNNQHYQETRKDSNFQGQTNQTNMNYGTNQNRSSRPPSQDKYRSRQNSSTNQGQQQLKNNQIYPQNHEVSNVDQQNHHDQKENNSNDLLEKYPSDQQIQQIEGNSTKTQTDQLQNASAENQVAAYISNNHNPQQYIDQRALQIFVVQCESCGESKDQSKCSVSIKDQKILCFECQNQMSVENLCEKLYNEGVSELTQLQNLIKYNQKLEENEQNCIDAYINQNYAYLGIYDTNQLEMSTIDILKEIQTKYAINKFMVLELRQEINTFKNIHLKLIEEHRQASRHSTEYTYFEFNQNDFEYAKQCFRVPTKYIFTDVSHVKLVLRDCLESSMLFGSTYSIGKQYTMDQSKSSSKEIKWLQKLNLKKGTYKYYYKVRVTSWTQYYDFTAAQKDGDNSEEGQLRYSKIVVK